MSELEKELSAQLARIRTHHEIVPFMHRILSTTEVCFSILPLEMMSLIRTSNDFKDLNKGAAPTWLQIASDNDEAAELIIYRARHDGKYYVIMPFKSPAPDI